MIFSDSRNSLNALNSMKVLLYLEKNPILWIVLPSRQSAGKKLYIYLLCRWYTLNSPITSQICDQCIKKGLITYLLFYIVSFLWDCLIASSQCQAPKFMGRCFLHVVNKSFIIDDRFNTSYFVNVANIMCLNWIICYFFLPLTLFTKCHEKKSKTIRNFGNDAHGEPLTEQTYQTRRETAEQHWHANRVSDKSWWWFLACSLKIVEMSNICSIWHLQYFNI